MKVLVLLIAIIPLLALANDRCAEEAARYARKFLADQNKIALKKIKSLDVSYHSSASGVLYYAVDAKVKGQIKHVSVCTRKINCQAQSVDYGIYIE